MLLALAAALGIVVEDHAVLRAEPRSTAAELETLWQGDLLEIRGERAGYLKVYDHRRERAGYLAGSAVRSTGLEEADAPELLAVLRFLSERQGSEALGISYGAAYLRAVPARALTAEPFDAIARMAERLADRASGSGTRHADVAAHLEVVRQFGVEMRVFDLNGRMQVCYEGDLWRRVLAVPAASAAEHVHAALGLTRPDCIDPGTGPLLRASVDEERRSILERIDAQGLTPLLRSRLHARRALVWASLAYGRARRGEAQGDAGQSALEELLAVHPDDLGEDRRAEYLDALVRVGASRWAAAAPPATPAGPLTLAAAAGEPGQTCVTLADPRAPGTVLVRRCTYGIVWTASAQSIAAGKAMVLAVQPLESWRELWVFHPSGAGWRVDVVPPGIEDPEEGYVEFAGFAPGTRRLLVAREVKEQGHFRRRFEELRLEDLALVRQASTPELLRDFGRWQDPAWRRATLALH
jgi:hypothetical protein